MHVIEFPPISTQEWMDLILKDLKGKDFEKSLVWNLEESCQVQPFYRKDDLSTNPIIASRAYQILEGRVSKKTSKISIEVLGYSDIEGLILKAKKLLEKKAEILKIHIPSSTELSSMKIEDSSHSLETLKKIYGALGSTLKEGQSLHLLSKHNTPNLLKNIKELINTYNQKGILKNLKIEYDFIHTNLENPSELSTHAFQNSIKELSQLKREIEMLSIDSKTLPIFKISEVAFYEAGAKPSQALGIILAYFNEYLNLSTDKSLHLEFDELVKSCYFEMGVSSEFFLEIARIRCLRLLYIQLIESYQSHYFDTHSFEEIFFLQAKSLENNKTNDDEYNNLLRSSTEAMSAILGGVHNYQCSLFTDDTRLQSLAENLAIQTQLLHRYESHLDKVQESSSGSYYIETLTQILCKQSWSFFQHIEKNGGLLKMLQEGKLQEEITKEGERKQELVSKRNIHILGVNIYPPPLKYPTSPLISTNKNHTPSHLSSSTGLRPLKLSSGFEKLRKQTELYTQKHKAPPFVFSLLFGEVKQARMRSNFVLNSLGCAGYEVFESEYLGDTLESLTYNPIEAIFDLWQSINKTHTPSIIVFCSSDSCYLKDKEFLEKIFIQVKEKNPNILFYIAGPLVLSESLQSKHIQGFLYQGMNLLETLKVMQSKII